MATLNNKSGGSCNYYRVDVKRPYTLSTPYQAECNDIATALGLTQNEFNAFKEIWRTANGRTNNNGKPDNNAQRAAEKILFNAVCNAIDNNVDIQKLLAGMNIK